MDNILNYAILLYEIVRIDAKLLRKYGSPNFMNITGGYERLLLN